MRKSNIRTNMAPDSENTYGEAPPDLHLAAYTNDVGFMLYCLDKGLKFDEGKGPQNSNPIHVACFHRSHDFLEAAIKSGQVDPWTRDACDRLPFDISSALGDRHAMKLLFDVMYSGPHFPFRDPDQSVGVVDFPFPKT